MIDNLFHQLGQLAQCDALNFSTYDLKNNSNGYIFLTLHRPSNVDSQETFNEIAIALNRIAEEKPIFFPVHPRTKKILKELVTQ